MHRPPYDQPLRPGTNPHHGTQSWPTDVRQPAPGRPQELMRPASHHGGHPAQHHHGRPPHWNDHTGGHPMPPPGYDVPFGGPNEAGCDFPQQNFPQPEYMQGERLFPFNRPPKETLVELLNRNNTTDFSPNQLEFGEPIAIGNTLTQIVAYPAPSTGWTQEVDLTYNRMYLETYLGATHIHLYTDAQISKESIIQSMKDRYRVWLEPTDFVLEVHNNQPSWLRRGQRLMKIRFLNESMIWIGAMDAIVIPDNRLGAVLGVTMLSGFCYPENLGRGKQMADTFYTGLDGTFMARDLMRFRVGDLIVPNKNDRDGYWAMGYRITGDPWRFDTREVEYNIYGARVKYNGPATGIWATGECYLNSVLVIELSHLCKNLRGNLIIPYDVRRENPCG